MRWCFLCFLACTSAPADVATTDSTAAFVPLGCEGGVCRAPQHADTAVGFHRVAVDEQGVAWVSWVETADLRPTATLVSASPGPGEPFGPAIEVPTAEAPMVGGTEKPSLDVFEGRIAIGHTGVGALRHGDAVAVYVVAGTVQGTRATFDGPVLIDESNAEGRVTEHAMVVLGEQHDDWLFYKRQVYGSRDVPTFARAAEAFEPQTVSDSLSHAHECSPPHLARGAGGQRLLTLRSNVAGTLQTMVLVQSGTGFGAPIQVSNSGWEYSPLVCPPDGPRIAAMSDGTLLTTWVAPHTDTLGAWLAWSTDGGATWADPVLDHEAVGRIEVWPTVTARADGSIVTTIGVLGGDTWRFDRSRVGAEPVAALVQGPGERPLTDVEVAHGGGRTVAFGQGPEGRLWLVELP